MSNGEGTDGRADARPRAFARARRRLTHGHDHRHGLFHVHDHGHPSTALPRLALAFGLTAVILVAEVVGGVVANSLALLADAAHMASDALGLLVALAAAWIGARPATKMASYGFRRAEVLAAMFNAVLVGAAGCGSSSRRSAAGPNRPTSRRGRC